MDDEGFGFYYRNRFILVLFDKWRGYRGKMGDFLEEPTSIRGLATLST